MTNQPHNLSARIQARRKATLKAGNYGARAGQVITGNLVRGGDGRFSSAGKPTGDPKAVRGVTLSKPTKQTPPKAPKAPRKTRSRSRRARIAKPKKTDEQRRQEQEDKKLRERQANRDAVKSRMAQNDAGLSPSGFDKLMAFAAGEQPKDAEGLIRMGLAERADDGSIRMTPAARQVVSASNRGDYQAAVDAISKATDRATAQRARAEQRAARQAERERRRAEREAKRREREGGSTEDIAGAMQGLVGQKSFAVFKDARGKLRWIARSTTAYRDRDREILPVAVLDADSQRMTVTKQFGPLRWWHVGSPDPFDAVTPWGVGLDLGTCDYSAQIGRTRVESGTFKDEGIGQKIAESADQYELSPGFFHAANQPQPDGTYTAIRTFERSLVPVKHGRASNLFTGLTVKEFRMDQVEVQRRLKAMGDELGLSGDQLSQFAAAIAQTDKAAEQQGIAYKSATVYTGPDGTPGIIQAGQWVALKAASPEPEAKADPPVEMEVETEAEPMEEEGQYIGDMTPAEFWAQLQQYLAPVLKVQELHKAVGDAIGEMKSMLGGYATKEAGQAAEIAQIKAALEQVPALAARLKALEGDQPLVSAPAEIEAALKSAGPQAPVDPGAVQVPNDPARPMAGIAARLVPELYTPWDAQQAPPVPHPQAPAQPTTWNGWPTSGQNNS